MKPQSIKTLLKKKSWTGRDVGTALLMGLAHDIKNKGKKAAPLFPQEDLDRMTATLTTEPQVTAYRVYLAIYEAIVTNFNKNQASIQQFYNGYYRYLLALRSASQAEDALRHSENYPLILTQAQYDRIVQEERHRLRSTSASFASIMFYLLEDYMNDLDQAPQAIRAAIEATRREPVTNGRILAGYNIDTEAGYYSLPDGRRSDRMSSEEWQKALGLDLEEPDLWGEPIMAVRQAWRFECWRLMYEGEEAIKEAFREKVSKDFAAYSVTIPELFKALESLSEGITERVGDRALAIAKKLVDMPSSNATWHYYEAPPEDLTKFDVLEELLERYTGALATFTAVHGEPVKEINPRSQLKEFREDYPAVYSALKDFIEENIAASRGLMANQQLKPITTWGELADLGIPSFKRLVEVSSHDITAHYTSGKDTGKKLQARRRIVYNGVAVLTNASSSQVDSQGNYIEPEDWYADTSSIIALAKDKAEADYTRALLEVFVTPALRYILAFNAFIEIVANTYDLDFIKIAQEPLSYQKDRVEALNNLIYMFYATVYGTEAEKAEKRKLIKSVFAPVHVDALAPSQERIDLIAEHLTDLGITREGAAALNNWERLVQALIGEGADK